MPADFIQNPIILPLLEKAEQLKASGKRFSDVEDAAGYQYVDMVQEGGGVLGMALVGYTYILEQAGIRFLNLAGTSAGAINTMLMACLAPIGQPVSEKILDVMRTVNIFDLVDGNKAINNLIQKMVDKDSGLTWGIVRNAIKIYKTLKSKSGINPGEKIEKWIENVLSDHGIHTLEDLHKLRKKLPNGLKRLNGQLPSDFKVNLAIIASEITTHTKVEFPKMAELYWADCNAISPAKIVRASLSIPFFFEPYQIKGLPNAGLSQQENWRKYARYFGEVPEVAKFVDGGMLSNFPINVFHRRDVIVPGKPTFGVRLRSYRRSYSNTDTFLGMCGAMIKTMRQIHDYDFILRNPDYSRLICNIEADELVNWLNFNIGKEAQIELFNLGAKKAIAFLEKFDWEEYKAIRKSNVIV